ncbi:MAG: gluconate 2-dehydrogenase subunit 3 family protein [Acidobacteria bacterium]|nr:gluconate 2-dehydrogenase subunit 3 family protein [Acidobacteriota bacterium]
MYTMFLLSVGERIAPGLHDLDAAGRRRVAAIVERAVAARPPRVRRQLSAFLHLLRWLPAARYGRPFDRLRGAQQDAVLRWFHDSPLAPFRHGFWGVKTLIFMGYYGRPEAAAEIGYRPARAGAPPFHAR